MEFVDKPNLDRELILRLKSHVYDIVGCCQYAVDQHPTGVLFNFAPFKDQCEKYYYDVNTKTIAAF